MLFVADEDRAALRIVSLPLKEGDTSREVKLPGAPALLAIDHGRVLITIRDPGLLLVLDEDDLVERARVELPADAWGLALLPDGKRAIVTSAWTHRASIIDLDAKKVTFSSDVAREPRGVVVHPNGDRAYITHLIGTRLTRIDLGDSPSVSSIGFPSAPALASDAPPAATLGYSAAFSADARRLFVPRQALNARGSRAWNGQPTVDVLLTDRDEPLAEAPKRVVKFASKEVDDAISTGNGRGGPFDDVTNNGGVAQRIPFAQPRAIALRSKTRTLLVASEGTDALAELDALSIEPAARPLRVYRLGLERHLPPKDHFGGRVISIGRSGEVDLELDDGSRLRGFSKVRDLADGDRVAYRPPTSMKAGLGIIDEVLVVPGPNAGDSKCGAPSGIALAEDQATAYVFCRSTANVVAVPLASFDGSAPGAELPLETTHLADDPLPAEAAKGRRLFYDARDPILSEGAGCASCHPEGREDGFVWREFVTNDYFWISQQHAEDPDPAELGPDREPGRRYEAYPIPHIDTFASTLPSGALTHPRQTPMLVGRVAAKGPYGWHGKAPDLVSRILRGSELHRWEGSSERSSGTAKERAVAIAAFVRAGLVAPPREKRELSAGEERGRKIFNDAKTQCASCHVPAADYTDRAIVGLRPRMKFGKAGPLELEEKDQLFKTPSLLYVGATAPYFHDGSAVTLDELVDQNRDRMGKTSHLTAEERADLVAFLRTL